MSEEYDDEMSGGPDNQRGASRNSNAGDGLGSGPMSDSKDPKSKKIKKRRYKLRI